MTYGERKAKGINYRKRTAVFCAILGNIKVKRENIHKIVGVNKAEALHDEKIC